MKQKRFVLILVLALVSGGLAGLLALSYLGRQQTPLAAAEAPRGKVVVAARDMPLGTLLTERDIRVIDWSGPVPANFVSSAAEAVGRGLITPVAMDEPLLRPKLSTVEEGGGLPILIPQGMRAVSVRVDQIIGVAGFVIPGTRVDVLLTLEEGEGEPTTRVILQDIRTLAAGQTSTRDAEGTPQTVSVVTLLVTPEQAETLTLAAGQGRIQLALRNTLDGDTIETTGVRVSGLFDLSAPQTQGGRQVRVQSSGGARPAQSTVVETIRGGERTISTFTPRRINP